MAKKEKAKKPEEPEAEKPAAAEGAEGEAPAKKKMAGKTLVLFIILPAVLLLGGGGAAAMMLLGGKKTEVAAAGGEAGHEKKPEKKEAKKDEHGGGEGGEKGGAAGASGGDDDVGHLMSCEEGNPCYYAMPTFIVNLAGAGGQREQALKLELTLEASEGAAFDIVPDAMPRIRDQIITYLRELRVEDLNGSMGTFRLRRELMKRLNLVMAPAKVDAVLIEGMLIQ